MIRDPIVLPPPDSELARLVELMCDGAIRPGERDRLESLLDNSDDAKLYYVAYLDLHAQMQWLMRDEGRGTRDEGSGQWPVVSESATPDPALLSTVHYPLSTTGSFIGSAVFSYMIAALILGVGLLIGAVTHVSQPAQFVGLPSPFGRGAGGEGGWTADTAQPQVVGRITGMVDCRFAESSGFMVPNSPRPQAGEGQGVRAARAPSPQSPVSLGDRFVLTSGLLEITYDTGAKVILQGPVSYAVESPAGGFLSIGKLTARVAKKVASGQWPVASKSELSNPQSLIPNPSLATGHWPLFTIATPTATVTDLGTEFGVEVNQQGVTSSHVFQGAVEVRLVAGDGRFGQSVRLAENESVSVEKPKGDVAAKVVRGTVDPAAFVRVGQLPKSARELRLTPFRRWQEYSRKLRRDPSLLAYYDFQFTDGSPAVLRNVAANADRSTDGVVENATWVDGRMPGKHALLFNDYTCCVRINLPQKTDRLTVAAWIKVQSLDCLQGILMSDGWYAPGRLHWQLSTSGTVAFSAYGVTESLNSRSVFDRKTLSRWRHVAVTYAGKTNRVGFYADGQPVGEASGIDGPHSPICIGPAWIGGWDSKDTAMGRRPFSGCMDEMVIFGRALDSQAVLEMYEEGRPQAVYSTKFDKP